MITIRYVNSFGNTHTHTFTYETHKAGFVWTSAVFFFVVTCTKFFYVQNDVKNKINYDNYTSKLNPSGVITPIGVRS